MGFELLTVNTDDWPSQSAGGDAFNVMAGAGFTVAIAGERELSHPTSYVISSLEIFPPAGSSQISCGNCVESGNCMPILLMVTVCPSMVVENGLVPYEFTSPAPLVASTPITSPAKMGMLTAITPVEGSFCVRYNVVNAFVTAG